MKGNCNDCKNLKSCKKTIGEIFGFCKTDFIPKNIEKMETKNDIKEDLKNQKMTLEDIIKIVRSNFDWAQKYRELSADLASELFEKIIDSVKLLKTESGKFSAYHLSKILYRHFDWAQDCRGLSSDLYTELYQIITGEACEIVFGS